MALFCAISVSYAGESLPNCYITVFFYPSILKLPIHLVAMIMHAAFRKLTPAKQPLPGRVR